MVTPSARGIYFMIPHHVGEKVGVQKLKGHPWAFISQMKMGLSANKNKLGTLLKRAGPRGTAFY